MIENLFIVAATASFLILLIDKGGWREKVQIYGPKLISQMFSCDFCISFWFCVLVSIILFIFVDREWATLLCPFIASPITRKLI